MPTSKILQKCNHEKNDTFYNKSDTFRVKSGTFSSESGYEKSDTFRVILYFKYHCLILQKCNRLFATFKILQKYHHEKLILFTMKVILFE